MLHLNVYSGKEEIPVLLIHGFLEDSKCWQRIIPCLAERGYTILTVDLPGFGNSQNIEADSLDAYANDLYLLLADKGFNQVHAVGHSLGGYTALAFAERFPQMLLSLTLLHSTTRADDEEKKKNRLRQIDIVKQKGAGALVDAVIPNLFHQESDKALTDEFIQNGKSCSSDDGVINALHAMHDRPDRTILFNNLTFPTLIIGGRHDALISPESLYEISANSRYGSIDILENSGHMGMAEEPQQCAALLSGFWQMAKEVSTR